MSTILPERSPEELNKLWNEHEPLLKSDDPEVVKKAQFVLDGIRYEVINQIRRESKRRVE